MARLSLPGERSSLRELAYHGLREAIVTLRIAPGERVTEEALSDELGVSRPVLRESLQRLQAEGLLQRADNGRIRVRPVTPEDVVHLYAVRSALEQLTVQEAAIEMTDEHLGQLGTALDRMRRGEAAADPLSVADGGGQFHRLLATVAANPVNDHVMRQLSGQIDRYRHLSVSTQARPTHSVREHEAIFAALRDGDVAEARAAMHEHIMAGRDAVLSSVRSLVPVTGGQRSA